jgi:hypothetical protein
MTTHRQPLVALALALACAAAAESSAWAQTTLFITDFFKRSGYTNVLSPGAEGLEGATFPRKLFELMVTPLYDNFRVCVYTEVDPDNAGQARIFAKKMVVELFGSPSGDSLAKRTVKGKDGEVKCVDITNLAIAGAPASAAADTVLFFSAEFTMKGNAQFEGFVSPVIWAFPFAGVAPPAAAIALPEGPLGLRQLDELRRKIAAGLEQPAHPGGAPWAR